MTENEKLNNIFQKVGYIPKYKYRNVEDEFIKDEFDCTVYNGELDITEDITYCSYADIREMIFTTDFMEKFINYRSNWKIEKVPCESLVSTFAKGLLGSIDREGHLDNPVEYLYNLIK